MWGNRSSRRSVATTRLPKLISSSDDQRDVEKQIDKEEQIEQPVQIVDIPRAIPGSCPVTAFFRRCRAGAPIAPLMEKQSKKYRRSEGGDWNEIRMHTNLEKFQVSLRHHLEPKWQRSGEIMIIMA